VSAAAPIWEALQGHERRLVQAGHAAYTDYTAGSLLWEPDPHRPGMRLSSLGRRVADHGRRSPG
jgi:hypothetical protein